MSVRGLNIRAMVDEQLDRLQPAVFHRPWEDRLHRAIIRLSVIGIGSVLKKLSRRREMVELYSASEE